MNTAQAITLHDGYKAGHKDQYPEKTELVYSNFTPRSSRVAGSDHIVVFGVQYFVKRYIIEQFNTTFFSQCKQKAVKKFKRRMKNYLGTDVCTRHNEALHDLKYMPVIIKSLPEGTVCPITVPFMTLYNTKSEFFWVTNMLESIISTTIWMPITSATTAYRYRQLMDAFTEKTCDSSAHADFQGHDFSMRGMAGLEAACMSSAGHALSFRGSDTMPVIDFLEDYYNADDETLTVCTVPATEHSVMCSGSKDEEIETFERLINKIYPSGIVSIVSDTWDFWRVITEFLPKLKDDIMKREGTVVIRPDCYDSETKVFTDSGWKYFKDLTKEDLVAQVLEDGTQEFVKPTKYFKEE